MRLVGRCRESIFIEIHSKRSLVVPRGTGYAKDRAEKYGWISRRAIVRMDDS